MLRSYELIIGALLVSTAIVLNHFNTLTGFFLGFLYGAGISLLIRGLIITIRKK